MKTYSFRPCWMLLTVGTTPGGREGWVCLVHMFHLSTREADTLSAVAKRGRDKS